LDPASDRPALGLKAARPSADVHDYERALFAKIQALGAGYTFLTRRCPSPIPRGSLASEALAVFQSRRPIFRNFDPGQRFRFYEALRLMLGLGHFRCNGRIDPSRQGEFRSPA
jgi:hypothetical protein